MAWSLGYLFRNADKAQGKQSLNNDDIWPLKENSSTVRMGTNYQGYRLARVEAEYRFARKTKFIWEEMKRHYPWRTNVLLFILVYFFFVRSTKYSSFWQLSLNPCCMQYAYSRLFAISGPPHLLPSTYQCFIITGKRVFQVKSTREVHGVYGRFLRIFSFRNLFLLLGFHQNSLVSYYSSDPLLTPFIRLLFTSSTYYLPCSLTTALDK